MTYSLLLNSYISRRNRRLNEVKREKDVRHYFLPYPHAVILVTFDKITEDGMK